MFAKFTISLVVFGWGVLERHRNEGFWAVRWESWDKEGSGKVQGRDRKREREGMGHASVGLSYGNFRHGLPGNYLAKLSKCTLQRLFMHHKSR